MFYRKLNTYICEMQTVLKVLPQFLYHEAIVPKELTYKSVCISEDIGNVIADCIDEKNTE